MANIYPKIVPLHSKCEQTKYCFQAQTMALVTFAILGHKSTIEPVIVEHAGHTQKIMFIKQSSLFVVIDLESLSTRY